MTTLNDLEKAIRSALYVDDSDWKISGHERLSFKGKIDVIADYTYSPDCTTSFNCIKVDGFRFTSVSIVDAFTYRYNCMIHANEQKKINKLIKLFTKDSWWRFW